MSAGEVGADRAGEDRDRLGEIGTEERRVGNATASGSCDVLAIGI